MELRHLRAAVAVAEHLHFGNAAAALGIAQPRLSQLVKALETDLGVALFDRDTRNVRLTAAGEAFVTGARTALSTVDVASERARAAGRGETGVIAIGVVGSAVVHPLPAVVRAFRARYPEVTLRFAELPTLEQVARLRADTVDVGFLRPPLPAPADDLALLPVSREPLIAVLPADHRLAGRERVAVRALADEPFVRFPRHLGPGLFDEITALCRRAGFEPRVGQEAVQMQTIVGLVASGCGVSIVPGSVAGLSRPDVVFKPVSPTTRLVDLALARRVGPVPPVVANFVAVTREVLRR
ncbi:LysR family transcriptional regulator [Kibdelosporangium aridum]|uniref:DNA-binding transcriptional regulator, LysR family n=1 Tax=Kibdelosporangium aridum TaxID=2030 RepID=A0A1W2AXY9_KIBAR|nr:LysR family transcriptional regulator [Kibdelosporangium aridum]SMC65332.1 DNA-binding transcriptional regulator, LysR family [Kibdelosporangium aridum]